MLSIKKIIKDIRWYTLAKIIPGFLGFLAIIVYTRFLSPEEYGLYILTITTISIVIAICFEWLNKSILRYFERYKQNGRLSEFISTVVDSLIGIIIVVLIFWYLGVSLLQNYIGSKLTLLMNIGGLVILVEAGYTFVLHIKQASQESFQYAIRSIINAIAKLIIAVYFIYFFHMKSEGILWAMIIVASSIFLWDIFSFYRIWQIKISYFSKKLFRNLLGYGLPLVGLSVASYILVAADRYMIKYLLNVNAVGVYSANYNLASGIIKFPMAILLLASYPIIMATFEKDGERATSLFLNKIISLYFVFLMPLIFGMVVLSKNIVNILLGRGFQLGYIIIPWISVGFFCFGLTQYFYKPFEFKEKTKILSFLVIFVSILNIILNFLFISKFGIIGAAYATLISYFVYFFSAWLISRKIFLWFFPWQTIIKTLLASIIMSLILYFIASSLPVSIIFLTIEILIGTVCYFIILWILKEKFTLKGFKYVLNYLKPGR
jgi:O-antigen/teichoic acid export membrane protein